ncbi:MAG: domain S-box, partial [Verrucomicrobiaceae bacterium]|nr:domain S-box [Verrucomicrobiaceae bacterium]
PHEPSSYDLILIDRAKQLAAIVIERKQTEHSLSQRTAELIRADRRKDEFLAMLAHELRNPLAPLRNAAEILREADTKTKERDQALRIVDRQIDSMTRMIDDLLDVARITEGRIDLRLETVSLADILSVAATTIQASLKTQGQTFSMKLPDEPVHLNGDATRLEQVFGNILTNAIKYSGAGSQITLSAERIMHADTSEVIVRVRDNGIGIEPELLPHVFDLFVQASQALDRAHGGLGIGLSLVQRLVKLHGGSVEAKSDGPGRGAEFVVRLPALSGSPQLPTEATGHSVVKQRSLRLLIVDDNKDSARTLAMLQKRRGHAARTAFTGEEALAIAADFLPEVVLLDIGLPGMDGFEVARRLCAMRAPAHPLLIAMSGYGREEDREEARRAGFDEYLVKPVDLARVRELLAQR